MEHKKKKLLTLPTLIWLLIFTVVPLVIMLVYSFQNGDGVFSLENYAKFFKKATYLKLTWRTIYTSLLVTVFSLIIAYPIAYALAKHIKKGKIVILALLIIPFFTNQLVRVYSWLIFLQDGGILQTLLSSIGLISIDSSLGILYTRAAVVIALVHAYFPYMIVTIYMALERMDDSLLEASRVLGASSFTTFRRVVFPTSMPGVISGILIVFVPCLGSFVEPRILGGTNGTVIGTVVETQFKELSVWNFGAAIAFILLLLVVISMALINWWGRRYDT